jgi:predicted nucleic acid-binding protein
MSVGSRGPVVIDTGVFGARLTPSGRLLASRYQPVLEARPAIISFVTVAELEYGAMLVGWGPDRLRRLEREIARAEIVWPGPNLAQAYASLRAWCVRTGHGLGQKEHEADRWVAATAVWLQIPLVAHDAIFTNVKDLELLTRLNQ